MSQRLLGRHDVAYYHCRHCGLLQTQEPYWLEEAYSSAIADTDTGILFRNLNNAQLLDLIIRRCYEPRGCFVDLAGGYGILTRLLRDRGFDCRWTDKYCENLVAKGFEAGDGLKAELMFAFEVFEHLVDPIEFIRDAFSRYQCRSLVLSTQTFWDQPPPADWWYYAVETGQHISFYQPRTLQHIARQLGCVYTKLDSSTHLITERALPRLLQECLQRPALRRQLQRWHWNRQRLQPRMVPDFEEARAVLRAGRPGPAA